MGGVSYAGAPKARRPQMAPKVPTRSAHPLVATFHARRVELGLSLSDVARIAGVTQQTISKWRDHGPTVVNMEAALNSVGLELVAQTRVPGTRSEGPPLGPLAGPSPTKGGPDARGER